MEQNLKTILNLLPPALRQKAAQALERAKDAEELRLRAGQEPGLLTSGGEVSFAAGHAVTPEELRRVLEIATGASLYSAREHLRRGYLTVQGGCRIGLCGTAVLENGEVRGLSGISSISIRIPHEVPGCAGSVLAAAEKDSVLLIGPPGQGKTTLLRDIVRQISNKGRRVALADERGEVAAVWNGIAQFDVGRCTDVMSGGNKADSALMLLRSMNPEVIAMDEITAPEDAAACAAVSNCGVQLLATAHALDAEDLLRKKLYRELTESRIFTRAVRICRNAGARSYEVITLC